MASTLFARERSFGGKAGIWFRKRKEPESGILGFEARVVGDGRNKNPRPKGLSLLSNVIGWDEVRSRPIYKEAETNKASNAGSDENTDDKGYDSPNTVIYNLKADSNVELKKKEKQAASQKPKNRNTKVRSYGRKRICTMENDEFMENLNSIKDSMNGKDNEKTATAITSSSDEATTNAPDPRRVSTDFPECSTTNGGDTTDEGGDSVFDFKNTDRPGKETKVCKTPKSRTFAPSSTTSLSAARAFFRELDSEQLNLTHEPSTTPRRRQTIRTRRKASLSNDQLFKEYSNYSAACEASQVSPLSIENYISNRSSYFRSMELYDGFLDE